MWFDCWKLIMICFKINLVYKYISINMYESLEYGRILLINY